MATNRTDPVLAALSFQAVDTASDMHKTVFAAVKGRKGQGFYQYTGLQFGAADRAGMGIAGLPNLTGPKVPAFVGTASEKGRHSAYPEK
jgi:hypothetical protein